MNTSQIKQVSATADVTTDDAHLRSVVLTGGSAASTLTVRAGGSGGTVILTLKAAIDTVAPPVQFPDAYCANGIHATVAGTGAVATFVYV